MLVLDADATLTAQFPLVPLTLIGTGIELALFDSGAGPERMAKTMR